MEKPFDLKEIREAILFPIRADVFTLEFFQKM